MVQRQNGTDPQQTIIVGTRGSPLARAQAAIAVGRLKRSNPAALVETRIIRTSGDKDQTSGLSDIGGKGLFIRELEQALFDASIDIAVHSFKDVTTNLAPGLRLSAFYRPESICDVLVMRESCSFANLPPGSTIGTGSMRRKALLGRLRPDLVVKDIRGNIGTRLRKLEEGMYDGVMLSEAGIMRLGINRRFVHRFDPQTFYPAPGQGVIALETRTRDAASRSLCAQTGDDNQRIKSEAEFALLRAVGFDCRAPIGAVTILDGSVLTMKGFIVKSPGGDFVERQAQGNSSDPAGVGSHLATLFLSA